MTPEQEIETLRAAIRKHRDQKADDRCWLDDQELYAVLGDGNPGDNHVGNQHAMILNCFRFIACRTTAGKWKSYAELEAENARLREGLTEISQHSVCCDARHCADRVLSGKPPKLEPQ